MIQLRGLTHEQQKCLRSASRQIESHKFTERLLHEQLDHAKKQLEKEERSQHTLQTSLERRMDRQEETIKAKLDKQKMELNASVS